MHKLQAIRDAIKTLLQQIDGTGDYETSIGSRVYSGLVDVDARSVPFCNIRFSPRTVIEAQRERVTMESTVTIHARAEDDSNQPDDIAFAMLGDIQRAMEGAHRTLGGLVMRDMQWERDEIFYPQTSQPVIAVEVDYSIPHIRHWGDPTK